MRDDDGDESTIRVVVSTMTSPLIEQHETLVAQQGSYLFKPDIAWRPLHFFDQLGTPTQSSVSSRWAAFKRDPMLPSSKAGTCYYNKTPQDDEALLPLSSRMRYNRIAFGEGMTLLEPVLPAEGKSMQPRLVPFIAVMLLIASGVAAAQETQRKSHPLAPSLPLLSDKENKKIEAIINRFILYDSGKLPGADGKKVLAEFDALGPEAIPQLLLGLGRAAALQESCPVVIIGRKLKKLLAGTKDGQLLDYARECAGGAGAARRHLGTLQDFRMACMMRKSYLQRMGLLSAAPVWNPFAKMSIAELAHAAAGAKGARLQQVLAEVEQRDGEGVIETLATALTSQEPGARPLAQKLLLKHLSRQKPDVLKKQLHHPQMEVRALAAVAAGQRRLPMAPELIELLSDEAGPVQQAARLALVRLSGGRDFGPPPEGSSTEREEAVRQWREWWQAQKGR
jgi:hypothetical protein